jgi:hypothetical protein
VLKSELLVELDFIALESVSFKEVLEFTENQVQASS